MRKSELNRKSVIVKKCVFEVKVMMLMMMIWKLKMVMMRLMM